MSPKWFNPLSMSLGSPIQHSCLDWYLRAGTGDTAQCLLCPDNYSSAVSSFVLCSSSAWCHRDIRVSGCCCWDCRLSFFILLNATPPGLAQCICSSNDVVFWKAIPKQQKGNNLIEATYKVCARLLAKIKNQWRNSQQGQAEGRRQMSRWREGEGRGDRRIQCLTKLGMSYAHWRRREEGWRASHKC